MTSPCTIRLAAVAALICCLPATAQTPPGMPQGTGAPPAFMAQIRDAAVRICSGGIDTPPGPAATPVDGTEFSTPDGGGSLRDWRLGNGLELRASRLDTTGRGSLYFIDVYRPAPAGGTAQPVLRAVTDGQCRFQGGQDVVYADPEMPALALRRYGPDLNPAGRPQPLNPALPTTGSANCGVQVALLDTGVNYLLDPIAERLAYGPDGALIGRDYREGDALPFDFGFPQGAPDPRISPFSPRFHGTGVASAFLDVAPPQACLAPYRYLPEPGASAHPDASTMIDEMAAAGARIVIVSSGRERAWPEFDAAMAAHPEVLFVIAAGNDGRDLATMPTYPAAYRGENVLVVAASDADGRLWPGSNRGAVDLAVPAVDLPTRVASGQIEPLTGTSIAAPRVAGFAARLAATEDPEGAAGLRAAVLAATQPGPDGVPLLPEAAFRGP